MEDVDIYLKEVLQKDAKLCKSVANILNNGPPSEESDDFDETSTSRGKNRKTFDPNSTTMDPINMSSLETTGPSEDADLTLHFAETNDLERECTAAHVKRLKRELEESDKRKTERPNKQLKRLQFTGKPIQIGNTVEKKPKHRRPRKIPLKFD